MSQLDFKALFSVINTPLLVLDAELKFVAMNKAYVIATGVREKESIGRSIFEVFPADQNDVGKTGESPLRLSLEKVLETRAPDEMPIVRYDIPIRDSATGEYEERFWKATHTPLFDSDGKLTHILHRAEDITDYMRAQNRNEKLQLSQHEFASLTLALDALSKSNRALRESELQFRQLANGLPFIVYTANLDGHVDWYNDWWYNYLELPRGTEWNDPTTHPMHPDDVVETNKRWYATVAAGEPFSMEQRFRRGSDGEYRWHLVRAVPVRNSDGKIIKYVGGNADIHDQKMLAEEVIRAKRELEEKSRLFETVLREIPTSVAYAEAPSGKLLFANEQTKSVWRHDKIESENIEGYREFIGFHPDGRRFEGKDWPISRAVATGQVIRGEEVEVLLGDGTPGIFRINAAPVRDNFGKIVGGVVTTEDVTEQVRAKKLLAQSKAQLEVERKNFEMLFEQSSGFVAVFRGPNFVYEYSNETNSRILSHNPTGKPLKEVLPDAERAGLLSLLERVYGTGKHEVINELSVQIGEELRYFTANYVPRRDKSGLIDGVMTWGMDVTDQVRARKQLEASEAKYRDAQRAAEAANAAKSNFLANMSHEIRTPLGAILGFSALLKERSLDPDEKDQYLDTIVRNGNALTRIIDDILDLAKVEAGKLGVEKIPFSLYKLATETVDMFKDKTKERDIFLLLNIDDDVPSQVCTDPTRLRQILVNLIGNAVKFTDRGGVRVNIQSSPSTNGRAKITIDVKDTGIGLTAEQKEKLFRPFMQADNSMTRKFGGTGLGLALSQRLAGALSGEITIPECTTENGSTFRLTFEVDLPVKESESENKNDKRADPVSLNGMKVLVVDDSPDNLFLVARLLTKNGAKVDTARDGDEGFHKALSGSYDLILMDIQMPVMDGYQAKQALDQNGYQQPVIALTAHAMSDERTKTRNAGFAGHLTKPLIPSELLETVARCRN